MFKTLHHKIIYEERDIWLNKMLILAIAFINGNLMTPRLLFIKIRSRKEPITQRLRMTQFK